MKLITDVDDDKKERARVEWNKFQEVSEFISEVAEFDRIYKQLKNSSDWVDIECFGDDATPPMHDLPSTCTEQIWKSLDLQDQHNELSHMSKQTEPFVDALMDEIRDLCQSLFGSLEMEKGGISIPKPRLVKKRRTTAVTKDIREVIDMSRCRIRLGVERLACVQTILNCMRENEELASVWEIVRIQNDFQQQEFEAYSTDGGYRDIRVQAKCLKTGYIIQIEFYLKAFRKLRRMDIMTRYPLSLEWQMSRWMPITDASQVMDMSLLAEIADIGLEAWNNILANNQNEHDDKEEEKVETLVRLGELKLLQFQKLSYDDRSLQKASLASKAVYYFDQALRITKTMENFTSDKQVAASLCARVLIGLSHSLCNYDWSIFCAARYHKDVAKRVELAPILFPAMNNEDTHYAIDIMGIEKATEWLGEKHPITLRAKYVKAEAMIGREGIDYSNQVIEEQRSVLGYDHPMVLETLITRYAKIKDVWESLDALNDIVEILQVNLERLKSHHPCIVRLLLCWCVAFQSEEKSFLIDAPGSKVPELVRILNQSNWEGEALGLVNLLKYALAKTVHSPDASKIRVDSRVAVWSWEHQNYWSGKVTKTKQGTDGIIIFCVDYDLAGNSEWISPSRRHTLLLSHGSHEPTPLLPQSSSMDEDIQIGDRMLLWYGFSYNSFFSATVESKDETQVKVAYDTNEHQYLSLEDLNEVSHLVTTRKDAGKAESVTKGDHIYVYWKCHKTYWLGKVLGVADDQDENDMEQPTTKFRIQFYSGDLHVCDLSQMEFYPESHPLF